MNQALPLNPPATREWRGRLDLSFAPRAGKTLLTRASHEGPLRVQRPFYPEGGTCHCYLLHPPGGIAPGDELRIGANLAAHSQLLLTTPSAGKIYTSDQAGHFQRQGVEATVAPNACLEWLPQETIVFSGARGELINRFHLAATSQLIGWDMVCLGRLASGEQFLQGECTQLIEVRREDQLLMRERTHWQGGSRALAAHWGMGGQVISGTLFATLEASQAQLDQWRGELAALDGEWGVSQKPGILLIRYLGMSAAGGRRGFEAMWGRLREALLNRPPCRPRIWNT